MGHIKNLDVRLMTLLAALVGAVTLIADGAGRVMFNGGFGARAQTEQQRSRQRRAGRTRCVILLFVVWIVSWILAPFITRLLAMGVSRKREYLADAMSAQFTRNPLALASALTKIENAAEPTRSIKGGAAHLCIADPLGRPLNGNEGQDGGALRHAPAHAVAHRATQADGLRAVAARARGRADGDTGERLRKEPPLQVGATALSLRAFCCRALLVRQVELLGLGRARERRRRRLAARDRHAAPGRSSRCPPRADASWPCSPSASRANSSFCSSTYAGIPSRAVAVREIEQ